MAEPLLLPTADPTAPGSAPPAAAVPTTTTFTSPASLADFQQPMQAYLATHPEFDGIAVGACVFSQPQPQPQSDLHFSTEEPRILLVQRAPTDSMPLLWEVPGGACDFEDESLLHAVARELREESGLRARRVEALVLVDGPGSGSASGPGSGGGSGSGLGDVFFTRRGRRMTKFSFLVEVESSDDVNLDPVEHVAFMWVTEDEARNKKCGDVEFKYTMPRQMQVVLKAFEMKKQEGQSAEKV